MWGVARLLANFLAAEGMAVTGLDASLKVGRGTARRCAARCVMNGDVYWLPYADAAFEAVCAMTFWTDGRAAGATAECVRVLKPAGCVFCHFQLQSIAVVAIKGIEWFVKDSPRCIN